MSKQWTEREIMRISGAYWAGCALQAAVALDVFSALDQGPKPEKELALELECNPRAFSMLVTALTSFGFLERRNSDTVCAPESALALLSRNSPRYLGFILRHHFDIMPAWTRLDIAVRTGTATAEQSSSASEAPADRENFLMGMFNIASMQAGSIADALDLSGRRRLLDVGGGPGTYAVFFCKKNPGLTASVFDLPSTAPFAKKIINDFGLEERIDFVSGNFHEEALPHGYDVVWLSQVLHGESPAGAGALVKKAGECLVPGGMICVQDFVLSDDRNGPEHPALFALNMLVQTPGGQTYTRSEIAGMLRDAGARTVRELEIALPQGCRVLIGQQ